MVAADERPVPKLRGMHSRLVAAVVATGALTVVAAACSDDDDASSETLPPILTTTSTSTSVAPTTTTPRFYEVQSGDTLTEIADSYGLPIQAIMETNGITDPDSIQAGQILELPNAADIVATSLPGQLPPTSVTPGASTTVTTLAP